MHPYTEIKIYIEIKKQTDRHTDRETDRHTDRRTHTKDRSTHVRILYIHTYIDTNMAGHREIKFYDV